MSDTVSSPLDTRSSNPIWQDARVRKAWDVGGPAIVIMIGVFVAQPLLFKTSPFGEPGLYLYGIILGLLGALVALGMALIYRANRILNFSQGELGLAPTVFVLSLIAYSKVPYVLGLVVGLAAAILLGGLIEFLIIRRFFRAPRLILTVATIGVSQLLAVGSLAIPLLWGKDPISQEGVAPFDFTFEVAPIVFRANHLLALLIAPVALVAIAIFLRRTNVGIAVRAAAERSDRASLLGVPVKRLQTVVWCIAATLSFIGVFLKAGINGVPIATNGGFGTTSFGALLAALAALTLGKFTNLPSIALSAVALGIVEQVVVWNNGNNPALVYPVFAVIILIGLLVQKTGQSRTEHDTASTWQAADEVRPIPRELRRVPEVLIVKWGGLAVIAFVAYKLPSFGYMDSGNLIKASAVLCFAMVGISIILLTGWAGQVSLGQMGFVGVGAALGAVVTKTWNQDLFLAIPLAGVAGAVVAVVVGLPALRVRGLFLAVTTLAFTITASNYLLNPQYATWIPRGRVERPPLFGRIDLEPQANMYYLCLVVLVLVILAVSGIRRSRTGRVLLALRENERGAQAFGINVARTKLSAFALSGFLAAVAGCLFVHVTQGFSADQFGAATSFGAFTSTVVGGLGSLTGGILGALFSRGGTWFLQGYWQLLPSAAGVLVVLLLFPSGLGGIVYRLRDLWLRSVARRYGIVVPSLLADVGNFQEPVEPLQHAEFTMEEDLYGAVLVPQPEGRSGPPSGLGAGRVGPPPDGPERESTTVSTSEPS